MRQLCFTLLLVVFLAQSGCISDGQSPDPVLQDYPIAYVKRPLHDADGDPIALNGRLWLTFRPGGDLYLRDRASPSATEKNITSRFTGGLGDVRDVEISYDGSKLLFSMRAPEIDGLPDDEQPTWNIWEYTPETDQLVRVIAGNINAEKGHDVAPAYLPDGRIVFSSTRQQSAVSLLLDEGKPQFPTLTESLDERAAVLHVMEADGTNIRQISFNMSHDFDPTVLSDGRILFSRWDNAGARNDTRLYTINPDGTQLQIFYGAHSARVRSDGSSSDPLQVRQMENGLLVSTQVLRNQNNRGGDLLVIDPRYIDEHQPTQENIGISGRGQYNPTPFNVRLSNTLPSPGGYFLSAFPLWDGTDRVLVSWTPCLLSEDGETVPCREPGVSSTSSVEADPLFGIYIYDFSDQSQRPVVFGQRGILINDVVTLRERPVPQIIYREQKLTK